MKDKYHESPKLSMNTTRSNWDKCEVLPSPLWWNCAILNGMSYGDLGVRHCSYGAVEGVHLE